MTFASVIARSGGTDTTGTSHALTLPAGASTGDLYVVLGAVGNRFTTVSISSSGWTMLGSTSTSFGVFVGVAGTASGSPAMTSANSQQSAHNSWIVRNWGNVVANLTFAITATGSSAGLIDPPAATPTAGSADYLWICGGTTINNTTVPNAAPSGWGNLATHTSGSGSSTAQVASAELSATATTENPGTFASSGGTTNWGSFTLAIPYGLPPAGGPPPSGLMPFFM